MQESKLADNQRQCHYFLLSKTQPIDVWLECQNNYDQGPMFDVSEYLNLFVTEFWMYVLQLFVLALSKSYGMVDGNVSNSFWCVSCVISWVFTSLAAHHSSTTPV